MAELSGHGFAVHVPSGWEAEIYRRAPEPTASNDASFFGGDDQGLHYPPIVHLSTIALPPERGDFGGGALGAMTSRDVFISLFEYERRDTANALFAHDGPPWPLSPDDFDPSTLRVALGDQTGCQRFFRHRGRAFALYVVLGSHSLRRLLVPAANDALAAIEIGA
ncbi:MAG: hypothetical protein ABIQ73_26230 [Acidimicrobiales bacterium]